MNHWIIRNRRQYIILIYEFSLFKDVQCENLWLYQVNLYNSHCGKYSEARTSYDLLGSCYVYIIGGNDKC